jgi:hypothetical protein
VFKAICNNSLFVREAIIESLPSVIACILFGVLNKNLTKNNKQAKSGNNPKTHINLQHNYFFLT